MGIVNVLHHWSIEPAVTVGHSSGEIAAAYASGYLETSKAIIIAFYRGQAVATNHRDGLMPAVGVGPDLVYLIQRE